MLQHIFDFIFVKNTSIFLKHTQEHLLKKTRTHSTNDVSIIERVLYVEVIIFYSNFALKNRELFFFTVLSQEEILVAKVEQLLEAA